jgi:hypothetical protein
MKPKYVLAAALVFALGCFSIRVGILHEGPQTQSPKHVRLKPEIRMAMNRADRIEIFAGGVHVGTVILDGEGGIFVGIDPTQAGRVTNELLGMLNMHQVYRNSQNHDHYD